MRVGLRSVTQFFPRKIDCLFICSGTLHPRYLPNISLYISPSHTCYWAAHVTDSFRNIEASIFINLGMSYTPAMDDASRTATPQSEQYGRLVLPPPPGSPAHGESYFANRFSQPLSQYNVTAAAPYSRGLTATAHAQQPTGQMLPPYPPNHSAASAFRIVPSQISANSLGATPLGSPSISTPGMAVLGSEHLNNPPHAHNRTLGKGALLR